MKVCGVKVAVRQGLSARLVRHALVLLGCAFFSLPALRAEDADDLKHLSLEQLGNIEVTTSTKEPVHLRSTAAAIYVITQEDIRRSGATSIADALRLAPGVEVSRISSTTWAVGIRGLQSNFSKSVLVMIDGRSVYTPLFAGVYWDVQDMLLEDIDRIEVIRGPGATIWGPNSANGVINIITRSARETHGLLVKALAGNVDRTIDSIRFGMALTPNTSFRVYAKGFTRAPEFNPAGPQFDGWHQERGGFRLDYTPQKNTFTLEGDIYGGNSPHLLGASNISNDSVSGGNVLARWRRDLGNGSDIYLQAYFDRTIRIGNTLGETRDTIDIDFLHHLRLGTRNDFSWGGGLRWSPNLAFSKQAGADILPNQLTEHVHSGFIQDEIGIVPNRVSLTLGAKLQHNNFSGFDAQPTGRLLITPNERQSFWTAVTRSVTTPSRLEEGFFLTGAVAPGLEIQVIGNPNFKSESVIGYEGGYRQLLTQSFSVDFSVFHNRYRDLQSFGAQQISTIAAPPTTVITIPYTNQIGGTTTGIEIVPTVQATKWWRLTGSYSYVGIDLHANGTTSDISSTGSVNTYENSTPHHQVSIQSRVDIPHGFEFDNSYRYESDLPAQKVLAYHTLDSRFGWNLGDRLQLSFVGQNLFQPRHREWGTGDPSQTPFEIRRAFYGRIVFRVGGK